MSNLGCVLMAAFVSACFCGLFVLMIVAKIGLAILAMFGQSESSLGSGYLAMPFIASYWMLGNIFSLAYWMGYVSGGWVLWSFWKLMLWRPFQENVFQVVLFAAAMFFWHRLMGPQHTISRFYLVDWQPRIASLLKELPHSSNFKQITIADEIHSTIDKQDQPLISSTGQPDMIINLDMNERKLFEIDSDISMAFNLYSKITLLLLGASLHLSFISGHYLHMISYTIGEAISLIELVELNSRHKLTHFKLVPTHDHNQHGLRSLQAFTSRIMLFVMILTLNTIMACHPRKISDMCFDALYRSLTNTA